MEHHHTIDHRWELPELPVNSLVKDEETDEEELIDEISERAESPQRSLWDIDQPDSCKQHKSNPKWTKDEDDLLMHLRRTMPDLSYKRMLSQFQGKNLAMLHFRWTALQRRFNLTPTESEDSEKIGANLLRKRQSWTHIEDKAERLLAIQRASSRRYCASQTLRSSPLY